MKQLIIAFLLFTGLTLAQVSDNVLIPATIQGDTLYNGGGGGQGTLQTPAITRDWNFDVCGLYYPVMDSSSQFTLYGKIKLPTSPTTYSDTLNLLFRDSLVTVTFSVDSSADGYIPFDNVATEQIDQFWLSIPDTVDADKTFYWILKSRK